MIIVGWMVNWNFSMNIYEHTQTRFFKFVHQQVAFNCARVLEELLEQATAQASSEEISEA